MTVTTTSTRVGIASRAPIRFGREVTDEPATGSSPAAGPSWRLQWRLRRNCSIAPRQLLASFLALAALMLTIGAAFWWHGAPMVLPFAGIELLLVGLAMLAYARHATDFEAIDLSPGRLVVERACGVRVERAEFQPAWVRIEPRHDERSLIELSGRGQTIAVGRFVRPEQRRALADELRGAVRAAVSLSSQPATT